MRRVVVIIGAFSAIFYCALCCFAQNGATAPQRRAKPPDKWDRRVVETYFPDARAALAGPRPQTAGDKPSSVVGPQSAPTARGSPATGAAGGFAWSQLISADTLQDEIKSLEPLLAADIRTQQGFLGGGFKKSRRTLSMLAAAFAVIQEYDADVRWKNQAAAARDLFAHAALNCKAASEPVFQEVKSRAEDLAAIMRGETVHAPENIDPKNHWDKVASRPPLMSRLELAQRDRITPWTSNAANFKKNAAALGHEAEIVAALAEVVMREGFEYRDDETYQGHARDLQRAATELRDAVQKNSFEAARTAAGNLSKACTACHGDFR